MSRPPHIHLINPFANPAGGSEWRTINLYEALRGHARVTLWRSGQGHKVFTDKYPIRKLDGLRLRFPMTGTFVLTDAYWQRDLGRWMAFARPRRAIITYNASDRRSLRRQIQTVERFFKIRPEVTYSSDHMRDEAGIPGPVEPPLIDLGRFAPPTDGPGTDGPVTDGPVTGRPDRPFTIGRLSRPNPVKHHADEPAFYQRLADLGMPVRVMGASMEMLARGSGHPDVTYLPASAEEPVAFLHGIDCFYYRTAPAWREPLERPIFEAMACGVPVVTEARTGNAQLIESGANSFLFDTQDEALEQILMLRDDPVLRRDMGQAARAAIEDFISPAVRERIVQFYIGEPALRGVPLEQPRSPRRTTGALAAG